MIQNLYDFKVSKQMKLAKIIMLVGIIAAAMAAFYTIRYQENKAAA